MEPVLIHHLRVIHPDGNEHVRELVACPATGVARPIEACRSCGRGHGTLFDERFDGLIVDCELSPVEDSSTMPDFARSGAPSDPREIPSSAVMTRSIVCVRAGTPLSFVRATFLKDAVSALPVLDAEDRPIGIVTPLDLLKDTDARAAVAEDVMTRAPIVVFDALPVARAAAIMAFEGVHHLLVKAEDGKIAGIVSSIDVCRFVGQASGSLVPRQTARQHDANAPSDDDSPPSR